MPDADIYRAYTPDGPIERADPDAFFAAVYQWLAEHTKAERIVVERIADGRSVIRFSVTGPATWAALFDSDIAMGASAAVKQGDGRRD